MKQRRSAFRGITASFMVIVICAIMLFSLVPVSLAGNTSGASVRVTIGPSISVNANGSVRSNVSTVTFGGGNFYTVVAR